MGSPLEVRWLGRLGYATGLALQERLWRERVEGAGAGDVLLLLEHEPVYTIGRTPNRSSLGEAGVDLPYPVHVIGRGGQATYHGPGQLVGYPLVDLRPYGRDLHAYLRTLEESVVDCCTRFGVRAGRREGLTGVWAGERKLASIGVGVRRWIALHGFALNVDMDLAPFGRIVPCGISGVRMTTLALESPGNAPGLREVAEVYPACLRSALARLAGA